MPIDVGRIVNAAVDAAVEELKPKRRKKLLTPGRALAVGAALAAAGRAAAGPGRRFVEEKLQGLDQDEEQEEQEAVEEPEAEAEEEEPEAEVDEEEPEAEERKVSPPRSPGRPRRAGQRSPATRPRRPRPPARSG